MLWTLFVVLIALWVLGFVGNIGGASIHLCLVAAGTVLLAGLVASSRTSA
jgi:Family of unknown function (DUF5670)